MASGPKDTYSAPSVTMSADIHGLEVNDRLIVNRVDLKWMVIRMDNNLYRIETTSLDDLPTVDVVGMLMTEQGTSFIKLHPVKLTAKPKKDTAEVVHGIWKIHTHGIILSPTYECSICHDWVNKTSRFCPNCGANMDGGLVYAK